MITITAIYGFWVKAVITGRDIEVKIPRAWFIGQIPVIGETWDVTLSEVVK